MQEFGGMGCCDSCSRLIECGGCQTVKGHPFDGNCIAAECIVQGGKDGFSRFKERLIAEINALEVNDLNLLNGFFCESGISSCKRKNRKTAE